MTVSTDVIVVGAGAIGLSCAYYLNQQGHAVTVVDKGRVGSGCSHGNAGLIVPSHVVPLAAPGVVSQGLKWLFKATSPFYIKPRLSPTLGAWLWRFLRACTEERMRAAIPVMHGLLQTSLDLFEELEAAGIQGAGPERKGMFMVYEGDKGYKDCMRTAELAREQGLVVDELGEQTLRDMEPCLPKATAGGIFFQQDAHLDPAAMVSGMRDYLANRGVVFKENTKVTGFDRQGSKLTRVHTDQGPIEGAHVVLAGGAWSSKLLGGIKLPVQAGKGYSITVDTKGGGPKLPMILAEAKVSVTPLGNQVRFGGTLELSGIDPRINRKRASGLLQAATEMVPGFDSDSIATEDIWAGYRPCTPDGLPIIGSYPGLDNLTVATGHAMVGISLAPVTDKLVGALVDGHKPCLDVGPLSVTRF